MEDEDDSLELRERLEEANEHSRSEGWRRYMALSTALIAVCAAIASLLSGNYANEAILEKNNAILLVNQATDEWNLYQAKGLKRTLNEAFFRQTHDSTLLTDSRRVSAQQDSARKLAMDLQHRTTEANERSEQFMEHHHKIAISVTLFQIAIALSAISALLMRRNFWFLSLGLAFAGLVLMLTGLL